MKKKVIIDEKGKSHLIWEYENTEDNGSMSDTTAVILSLVGIVVTLIIVTL